MRMKNGYATYLLVISDIAGRVAAHFVSDHHYLRLVAEGIKAYEINRNNPNPTIISLLAVTRKVSASSESETYYLIVEDDGSGDLPDIRDESTHDESPCRRFDHFSTAITIFGMLVKV